MTNKDRAKKLYSEGFSRKAIADKIGVSYSCACNYTQGEDDPSVNAILRLSSLGNNAKQVAKSLGIQYQRVARVIRKHKEGRKPNLHIRSGMPSGERNKMSVISDKEFEKLYTRVCEGETMKEVNKDTDLSYSAFANRVRVREKHRAPLTFSTVTDKVDTDYVEWIPIEGIQGYFVSADGRVCSERGELSVSSAGSVNIGGKQLSLAKLVALTFLPNPNGVKTVRKIDPDGGYGYDNLYWYVPSGRVALFRKKVSVPLVEEILYQWSTGKYNIVDIRDKYKVKRFHIEKLLNKDFSIVEKDTDRKFLESKYSDFDKLACLPANIIDKVIEVHILGKVTPKQICEELGVCIDVVKLVRANTPAEGIVKLKM